MSRILLCSLVAIVLGSADPAWGDDAKRDADKLQGTWQATEGMSEGKPLTREHVQRLKVVFSGEKMSISPLDGDGKKALEYTFRVDPGKKPKAINATRAEGGGKGKTVRGIYELDGDTLRLCLTSRFEKERPTEFAAPEKSGLVLVTLTRVKK
jgi:uncharacterized protein (TIGR03067 family)